MKIDGHCHCRQITFEAKVDPTALTICHCTDCQTLTGSAFRINIPASAEHFVLRGGTPKSYVKTAVAGGICEVVAEKVSRECHHHGGGRHHRIWPDGR